MTNTSTTATSDLANKYTRFTNGYYGRKLLKSHNLEDTGVWEVIGEGNENGDNAQTIGLYSGKLKNVIYLAIGTSDFWSWGRGGQIRPRDLEIIPDENQFGVDYEKSAQVANDTVRIERDALLAKAAELTKQLEQ